MGFSEPCMCGAMDCFACRGHAAYEWAEQDAAADKWGDTDANYVQTLCRGATHVARKEHSAGTIQPGDTYRRVVRGGYIEACEEYPEGGPRWMTVSKKLIKKADPVMDQRMPV